MPLITRNKGTTNTPRSYRLFVVGIVVPLDVGDHVLLDTLGFPLFLDPDDLHRQLYNATALPSHLQVEQEEHQLLVVQEVVHLRPPLWLGRYGLPCGSIDAVWTAKRRSSDGAEGGVRQKCNRLRSRACRRRQRDKKKGKNGRTHLDGESKRVGSQGQGRLLQHPGRQGDAEVVLGVIQQPVQNINRQVEREH